jgi:glyoxylase-like metal-dependent hydrolase (beta-lactamase superfamily II)
MPLRIASQRALVFGDAVVGTAEGLRVWEQIDGSERRERWYAERFLPTLEPLALLDIERVLVTHGPSVIRGGRRALRDALAQPPWHHRG